jgi:hypothetical protein
MLHARSFQRYLVAINFYRRIFEVNKVGFSFLRFQPNFFSTQKIEIEPNHLFKKLKSLTT